MPDIAALIQAGAANPWLYLPLAVLLGALHALEPGHSKTMMAGFIIAVRGTPAQAVLLGVSAAVGHTLVVWALALIGLWLGDRDILRTAEPWLVLVSGLLVMGLAMRIFLLLRPRRAAHGHHHAQDGEQGQGAGPLHRHHHDHDHDHEHEHGHRHGHDHGDPHHHGHAHAADHHGAAHRHPHRHAPAVASPDGPTPDPAPHAPEDAHAAAHARAIRTRYAGRTVTAVEVVWFGFTGGLLPCPAAIAVLFICLQLKEVTLGIGMVAAFSLGLAVTLVAVGLAAAWGTRVAGARFGHRFEGWSERLPYVSASLVFLVGLAIAIRGLVELGQA
ncbi:HoxN/HupN/NixA family nickel/cobalt transporter [Prosthecomicrobium sp. N25]|uniref:HoxN/HupN/NixA family nickel/cobalt transporter n=1 Tax=Prosthecomicrobium sp. N25 TaxID=3129254 RepID=UPI003077B5BD